MSNSIYIYIYSDYSDYFFYFFIFFASTLCPEISNHNNATYLCRFNLEETGKEHALLLWI